MLKRTLIDLTIFIEIYEKKEVFRLSPLMQTQDAIRFIQENDFCGAEYSTKVKLQSTNAIKNDLILVPPDTITDTMFVQLSIFGFLVTCYFPH